MSKTLCTNPQCKAASLAVRSVRKTKHCKTRLWSELLLPWEGGGRKRNRKVILNWALMSVPGTGGVQPPILSCPVLSHHVPSHPVPSHPIPSHPIPSHPIPSHPIPSWQHLLPQTTRLFSCDSRYMQSSLSRT